MITCASSVKQSLITKNWSSWKKMFNKQIISCLAENGVMKLRMVEKNVTIKISDEMNQK